MTAFDAAMLEMMFKAFDEVRRINPRLPADDVAKRIIWEAGRGTTDLPSLIAAGLGQPRGPNKP